MCVCVCVCVYVCVCVCVCVCVLCVCVCVCVCVWCVLGACVLEGKEQEEGLSLNPVIQNFPQWQLQQKR